MRFKKFLIIPALLFFYIFFVVDFLVSDNFVIGSTSVSEEFSPEAVSIGVSQQVSVQVTRPYFFGLIRLPIYSSSLGNIAVFHEIFFYFIGTLTVIFILMEFFPVKSFFSYGSRFQYKFQRREYKMAKFGGGFVFDGMKFLKALIIGTAIGLVSFILSGDGGPSVALALLIIYLEYRI